MSKDSKDQVDWRGGSDAFFRAVRADHEATAVDFARVEAELARRLAAGAPAQPALDGDPSAAIAKPERAFTFGKVAKLWVGLTLLAAGSYGVLRTVEATQSRSSQVAGSLQPAPPQSAPPQPSAAAMSARPDALASDSSDTQLPHTEMRDEGTPRPPSPRVLHRDASESKRANARRGELTRSHTPASTSAATVPSDAKVEAAPSSPTSASISASARPDANVPSAAVSPASTRASSKTKVAAAPSVSAEADASRVGASRTDSDAPVASRSTNASASTEASARGPQPQKRAVRDHRSEPAEGSDGRAELALVERMQAAMRAAQAVEALALCAEHAKRWPRGVFVEEREAVRAIASCTLRSEDAATHAQVFLSKHRRAPTAPRVAEACAPLLAAAGITVP